MQADYCTVGLLFVLQVLKATAEKFPDFVSSNLAPGVMEAFEFHSRLWSAKHPGQPLPKGKAQAWDNPQEGATCLFAPRGAASIHCAVLVAKLTHNLRRVCCLFYRSQC